MCEERLELSRRRTRTFKAGMQATIIPVEHSRADQAVTVETVAEMEIAMTRQIAAKIVRNPSMNANVRPTSFRRGRLMVRKRGNGKQNTSKL